MGYNTQKYLLHAILTTKKINHPAILFNHLKTTITDSRDGGSKKKMKIIFGRLISYILVESHLFESLNISNPNVIIGASINGITLRYLGLKKGEEILDPEESSSSDLKERRIPVIGFPNFLLDRSSVVNNKPLIPKKKRTMVEISKAKEDLVAPKRTGTTRKHVILLESSNCSETSKDSRTSK